MRTVSGLALFLPVANAVGAAYTLIGAGPCRGYNDAGDNPNRRSMNNVATEAACEAHCDSFSSSSPLCTGFAYESTGAKNCILYGPGMAGVCAAPNTAQVGPTACNSVGTCDSGGPASASGPDNARGKTGVDWCGTCAGGGNAEMRASCVSAGGTWTAGTWTQTGVFEEAAAPWSGEFGHTTHVHGFAANVNYVCYDKDVTDHIGSCAGSATTPSGINCNALFTAAATYDATSCMTAEPENCAWTATRTAPAPRPAHPAPTNVEGYAAYSGACRGTATTAGDDDPQLNDRPNYVYTRNSAFPTIAAPFTAANLKTVCDAINTAKQADDSLPDCVGFHSGPWTALFGNGMNSATWASGALNTLWEANGGSGSWAPEPGNPDTNSLSGTKPNHQYFCFIADAPCFPSTAMVTKADGTSARVDALKEGDAIVATTDNGTATTDTVSFLSIAKPEARAPFVELRTSAGQALTLTEAHHVPVGPVCCSTLKQAKEIAVGDTVWWVTVQGHGAAATVVTAKSYTAAKGLHSPVLTHGGFPVVDGIVTAFDSIEKVTLAKHGLAPLVAACKATGTCENFRHTFFGDDVKYVK
jgi:hypothetical protein